MATTTAQITLTSSDLLTDALSLSSSTSLNQAGGSTGIINTTGLARKKISFAGSGVIDSVVLYRGDDYTADKSNKIYLKNTSTDDSEYFEVMITGDGGTAGGGVTELGRLYAGDWAFFPWNATGGTKETFIATIADTWAAGDTWEFDGVEIVAANSTVADIAAQIDAANFPNWVTSRDTAAITFVARYALDAGTVATATADIVVDTTGDGSSAVSSSSLGTKSLSDIYIKPSVHTGMTLEHMLFYE